MLYFVLTNIHSCHAQRCKRCADKPLQGAMLYPYAGAALRVQQLIANKTCGGCIYCVRLKLSFWRQLLQEVYQPC